MKFLAWFNEYKPEHLRAYKHLQETGQWPKYFLDRDIEFESAWQILLAHRLANAWITHMLSMHL